MDRLTWLENSALGLMVSSSVWGYPIVLSLHAIGMGALVGMALMLSFRVLGLASAVPTRSLAPYRRIAQAGFVVNLVSGVALFCGNATTLSSNWSFWIKLVLVLIGLMLTHRLANSCLNGPDVVTRTQRSVAVMSVIAWLGALIAGRLIGYFG